MTQDNSIRWLHLTDLHMGMDAQGWLWPTMKSKFHEDLKKIYDDAGPWDLVFFTGDLAQKGGGKDGEEYKKLDEMFNEMWGWFDGLGCNPVLLAVPGNHDLLRPPPKKAAVKALERWHEDEDVRNEIWKDAQDNEYLTEVKVAFAQYTDWWNRTPYRPDDINLGYLPGDFSFSFRKNDLHLGIVGLNSAFLQLTDKKDYQGRLVIDPRQCVSVTPDKNHVDWVQGHNACFLMTHHPMNWLHPDCRRTFNQEALESFCLHLCGHQHETEVFQNLSGGAEFAPIQWTGRSLFGLEKAADGSIVREHGYVAGKLSFSGDEKGLRFFPRRREEQGNKWSLIPDHKGVELSDERRTRVFPIRWLNENLILACAVVGENPSTPTVLVDRSSDDDPLLPKVAAYLKEFPDRHPSLHALVLDGLNRAMPKVKFTDLGSAVRAGGVHEILAALRRWLNVPPSFKSGDIADLKILVLYMLAFGIAKERWLTEARESVPEGVIDVTASINPFAGAVLLAAVFDTVVRLKDNNPDKPEHFVPLSSWVTGKSYDSRKRLDELKEYLRKLLGNDDEVLDIFWADMNADLPWFTFLDEDDDLLDEIAKDGLSGLLLVLRKRKEADAVITKVAALKHAVVELFKRLNELSGEKETRSEI